MERSEIPSLDDLRAFEATARHGSVRLAADSLALTHGAVSRRISKLARDLRFDLFEKSGRGLRLTEAGETLNLTLARFFAELAETVDRDRASFIKQYFDVEWPGRHRFHLMVNSGMGDDVAVETILDVATKLTKQRT